MKHAAEKCDVIDWEYTKEYFTFGNSSSHENEPVMFFDVPYKTLDGMPDLDFGLSMAVEDCLEDAFRTSGVRANRTASFSGDETEIEQEND